MGRRDYPHGAAAIPTAALVLEDQILIALELEAILLDLGYVPVCLAASVDQAMLLLDTGKFRVAVLDHHLGAENSKPVAMRLRGAGIPFLVVTGHDIDNSQEGPYLGVPVIFKPFTQHAIQAALASTADQ